MYIESTVEPREASAPVGSDAFAEGLLLVRASTLKMIRLQLAIERQDRLVALEAVDGLVALDRRFQDYLDAVPASADQLGFRRALDADRAALNQEKLTLAAEVLRRPPNAGQPEAIDEPAPAETAAPEFEPEQPRRSRQWLFLVPILLLVLAGAGWFAFADPAVLPVSLPDAQALLANVVSSLR